MSARGNAVHGVLGILTILAWVVFSWGCGEGAVADTPTRSWDSDGDGISDAVELETHNRELYHFDVQLQDYDISVARGFVDAGTLENGINLPDTGAGYIHFPVGDPKDTDDWGTLTLVNLLEQVAREYRNPYGECNEDIQWDNRDYLPRPQYNDLSLQFGGSFQPDHTSHQNGLDVDVRYLRLGERNGNEIPLDLRYDSAAHDVESTLELLTCFWQNPRVIAIYYDSVRSLIDPPTVNT